ncbi:di-heme oxidoredictase family protein [Thalassobaculum sp. OXR-137]|uniref:di-heme oxidoreductase family protein n=1 Tax=Thalassobaculum sp. OXR-137 TaxID=3100173 RepID=UPI002AC950D8|nr:di-heme oxidoredictase family protein [Thalassobaculum sp. OXR-137]WPZ36061.1 di-heme oxidoredictase family protein [Thalassobaculum sp. OXR-137]
MRRIQVTRAFTAFLLAGFAVSMGFAAVCETAADPAGSLPAGDATSLNAADGNAFSHSSATLPFEKELDFKVGNGIFKKLWVSSPASTKSSDGLGPLYNARACQRCHLKDGRGHPPAANFPDDNAVSMLIRLGIPISPRDTRPDPVYGGQLQDFAVAGIPIEGRPHVTWTEELVAMADGTEVSLRRPDWTVVDLGYGPMDPETRTSVRIAPPMIGLGLLEAVPADQIAAYADPDDANGDGISGRAAEVTNAETGEAMLGRFGWKASQPTLRMQAQAAFLGDMGLATTAFPFAHGDCTEGQKLCREAPGGGSEATGLEVSETMLKLVVFYSRHLAVPARRNLTDPAVSRGEAVFAEAGCASCHRPSLTTAADAEDPALAGHTIFAFTDMLLHDMGPDLADGLPEGDAEASEWRTPPLWGIGLTETVNGHTNFLHDGRARSLLEAILWHGGEARAARDHVVGLDAADRDALIAYINSL